MDPLTVSLRCRRSLLFKMALCDLYSVLKRTGRLSTHVVRFLGHRLYSALMFMHSQRIVHMDVKPENVLITSRGDVLLTDLGHAIVGADFSHHPMASTASASYQAPECFLPVPGKDLTKMDVWSAAVTLLTSLLGFNPYQQSKMSPQAEWHARLPAAWKARLYHTKFTVLANVGKALHPLPLTRPPAAWMKGIFTLEGEVEVEDGVCMEILRHRALAK